jgi:hypothetical protein
MLFSFRKKVRKVINKVKWRGDHWDKVKWNEVRWSEVKWGEAFLTKLRLNEGKITCITYPVTGTPQCTAMLILLLMQLWLYSFCVVIQFIVWAVLCSVSVNWPNSCVVLGDMSFFVVVCICLCYLLCHIALPLPLGWQPICTQIIIIIIKFVSISFWLEQVVSIPASHRK